MIRRLTPMLIAALLPASAMANKFCVVDAETAINSTTEGKSAQTRLESLQASKQQELETMGKQLEQEFKDYESRASILSDSARQAAEQQLMAKQQQLQQMAMAAEQEMQGTYMQLLGDLENKLMTVAADVGQQKGCTVLFQKQATIYVSSDVSDLTNDVISAYNARH